MACGFESHLGHMNLDRAYKSYEEVVVNNPNAVAGISFGEYLFSLKYDMPLQEVVNMSYIFDQAGFDAAGYRLDRTEGFDHD